MKRILAVFAAISMAGPALAGSLKVGEADRQSLSLVIYQSNFAVVKESRLAALAKGRNLLEIEGVAQTLRPDSVIVEGKGIDASSVSFNGESLSLRQLLTRNVGREATVAFSEPGGIRRERGLLLSVGEDTVWNIAGRVIALPFMGYVGSPVAYYEFDSAPEGVGGKPILRIGAECAGDCGPVGISYQADNLGWDARYTYLLDEKALFGPLSGWAVMRNGGGIAFPEAKVTLMAGDVARERAPMQADYAYGRGKMLAMEAPAPAKAEMVKKLEYHAIEMPGPITLASGETRQERFAHSPKATAKKILKIERMNYYLDRPMPEEKEIHPDITLKIENTQANGLGSPLPEGIFRVYSAKEGLAEVFLGEDRIEGVQKNGSVELRLGQAFDISASRRTISSKRIDQWTSDGEFEIALENGGEAATVEIAESFGGRFKIIESTHPFESRDADTVVFRVEVPKEGKAALRVRARLELYH